MSTAENPEGPWTPLHCVKAVEKWEDPCPLWDDDGQAYLYWGSGLNWVNGKCFMVSLADNMVDFLEGPVDVTPSNYFEGPVMMKEEILWED